MNKKYNQEDFENGIGTIVTAILGVFLAFLIGVCLLTIAILSAFGLDLSSLIQLAVAISLIIIVIKHSKEGDSIIKK